MKAVNLLPPDLRGASKFGGAPVREPVGGIGAYVVLGALALGVVALAAYVLAGNAVKQRQAELADVTARSQAITRDVAQLKPYADFEVTSRDRVQTVKGLIDARFEWERALRDLSRALPDDVRVTELDGDLGLGTNANGGAALRTAIHAPALELKGCAPDQSGVARLMARLRSVQGVTRVTVASSDKTPNESAESGCREGRFKTPPPQFDVIAFFEHDAASAALAPVPSTGASGPGVPVPSAIAGSSAAKTGGNGSSAAGASSGSASTTPSTTSGANP